jgi:TRAP-type mannitol/chloroaromatic compound transport system permease large subunit
MKGTLPAHLGIGVVYRGIVPFFLLQLLGLIVVMLWPEPFLWLPRIMSH